jgi:hypothetical protein
VIDDDLKVMTWMLRNLSIGSGNGIMVAAKSSCSSSGGSASEMGSLVAMRAGKLFPTDLHDQF